MACETCFKQVHFVGKLYADMSMRIRMKVRLASFVIIGDSCSIKSLTICNKTMVWVGPMVVSGSNVSSHPGSDNVVWPSCPAHRYDRDQQFIAQRWPHISQLGKLARKAMWSENVPFHGFGSAEMRGLYTTMLSICSSVCLFVRSSVSCEIC